MWQTCVMGNFLLGMVFGLVLAALVIAPTGYLDYAQWAAVIVALAALGLAIWQGSEMRKHQRLLAKPHCSVNSDYVKDPSSGHYVFVLTFQNAGPGVAHLKALVASYHDKELALSSPFKWRDMIAEIKPNATIVAWHANGIAADGVFIHPEDELELLRVELLLGADDASTSFSITPDIWSIYDEQIPHETWTLSWALDVQALQP